MSRALFLATLLVALPAAAQSQRVEALGWMAGSWEQSGRERVMETWTAPANGMMVGASLTTSEGRRSFEFMRIVDTKEGMSYLASPGGRPAVEFKLRETGDRKVVFENLGHDYPSPNRVQIVIWIEDRGKFGTPERRYYGRTICVRGLISSYRGVPEIIARSPSQIAIA